MTYKAVIFDFDGTLADSFHSFLQGMDQSAKLFGFRPPSSQNLGELRGLSAAQFLKRLDVPAWMVPLVAADVKRRMSKDRSRIQLFPDVAELLRSLHKHDVRMAIVTSNSRQNVQHILGKELNGLMDFHECGAGIFSKKKKYLKILARSNWDARKVLCVGDELRDAEAAGGAGLRFMGVGWGYTQPEQLARHSFGLAHSMGDILKAVLG